MTDPSLILSFRNHLRACTRCPIHANEGGPIPWSGGTEPKYAILGEAPGKTEAQQGEPFVGDTGNILRHWLKQVGINDREVSYLNSVACWPNRSPATPTNEEMVACRGWMNGQLEFIRPQILITLGVVAFTQIREGVRWPKLAQIHGKPWFHPRYHFSVFSTYHPAAYLRGRNSTYEKKITDCLKAVAGWDGRYLEECCVCEDELYRYGADGLAYCMRHSLKQGMLFSEDAHV